MVTAALPLPVFACVGQEVVSTQRSKSTQKRDPTKLRIHVDSSAEQRREFASEQLRLKEVGEGRRTYFHLSSVESILLINLDYLASLDPD